jgi:hypothetical protein
LAANRLATGLFPRLERSTADVRLARGRLEAMLVSTTEVRREIAGMATLGAQLTPLTVHRTPPLAAALAPQ